MRIPDNLQPLRRCGTCRQNLPTSLFSKRGGSREGWQHDCKECSKKRHREWQKLNREIVKNQQKSRRIKKKQELVKRFGAVCLDCGGKFPDCVYDFHHLDPTKKDYYPAFAINQLSFEKMEKELAKCVMLCANCHRIRHFNEGSS